MNHALDAAIAAIEKHVNSDYTMDAIKAKSLMIGYHNRWKDQKYITEIVEQEFSAPCVNVKNGRKTNKYRLGGKVDIVAIEQVPGSDGVLIGSNRVLIDHKTTSHDIAYGSEFWQALRFDGQASQYSILLLHADKPVDRVVYDVIRKPTIRQKKNQSIEDFGQELAEDCTNVRPDFYFAREVVPRLDHEILEYAREAWMSKELIDRDSKAFTKDGDLPKRNPKACFLYGSTCKFLDVCSGRSSIDDETRWARKSKIHGELKGQPDGHTLLTYSSMSCHEVCARKYHYEYRLGIDKVGHEESEALRFGSLFHEALAAWWECYR